MTVACNKNFNVLIVNQYLKVTYMEKSCIKWGLFAVTFCTECTTSFCFPRNSQM